MPLPRPILVSVIAIVAFSATAHAQIKFDVDQATFAYADDNTLVEIYMAFDAATLPFAATENGMLASLPVIYRMHRSTTAALQGTPVDPVWTDTSEINFLISDTSLVRGGQYFVHQSRAAVPPGEYDLGIVLPPVPGDSLGGGRPETEFTRQIVVPDYESVEAPALSEVTLASNISQSGDRGGVFYKNGLEIRPNPNAIYGGGVSRVFYYAEAYNIGAAVEENSKYNVLAYVAEANRPQAVGGLEKRSQRDVRSPDVLVGAFDISKLPSGSYFLRLVLLGPSNEAIVERSRKFFVYNPDVQREVVMAEEVSFEASEFASLSEEDLELTFKRIDNIATDRERRRMKSIEDPDERRRFLYDFWLVRDPNPGTRDNEFREEFHRRVQYANERYTSSFTEGWESDRGRVILRHGMPSNVEPHLYDRGMAPYEVWQYNNIPGEGQGVFIFGDPQGFGEFELMHSTVSGERQNPQWQQDLARR